MILVRHRCPEQRHNPITHKLVYDTFIVVYRTQDNLDAAIHQIVHGFLVKLLGDRCRIGQVGEQHGDYFPLAFDVASMTEDFIGQKFRRIVI